jgi:hypothetical protein
VGIGNIAPKTELHITNGKVYVEANGQGVINEISERLLF